MATPLAHDLCQAISKVKSLMSFSLSSVEVSKPQRAR